MRLAMRDNSQICPNHCSCILDILIFHFIFGFSTPKNGLVPIFKKIQYDILEIWHILHSHENQDDRYKVNSWNFKPSLWNGLELEPEIRDFPFLDANNSTAVWWKSEMVGFMAVSV